MVENGIQPLVDEIARILGKGVSLDDLTGHLVAYSVPHGRADDARIRTLLTRQVPTDVLDWQARHGVNTAVRPVEVPPNPALGMLTRICVPLLHRGVRTGLLWILQSDDTWSAAAIIEALDPLTDRLDMLASLQYEIASPHLDERRQRDLTFYQACRGDRVALQELTQSAAGRATEAVRLVVSLPVRDTEIGALTDTQITQLRIGTQQALATQHHILASSVQDTHTVALLRHRPGTDSVLNLHLHLGAAITSTGTPWKLYTGVSTPQLGIQHLPDAYQQALTTAQVAAIEPENGTLAHWENIGAYQFIATYLRPETRPVSELYERLRAADPTGQLTATLETYYDQGDSVAGLAERLHLHRTTLYYRLSRVKDIIGADPLNGAPRLELHLAIKADRWSRRPKI